jgi:rhamnosyltransferase subunit B
VKNKQRFILNPVGTAGDVHPFLAIGSRLLELGHEVIVLTNPLFRDEVLDTGLQFESIGEPLNLVEAACNKEIQSAWRAWQLSMRWCATGQMRETFLKIKNLYKPGATTVVSPVIGFGARLSREVLPLRLISMIVSPMMIRSRFDAPRIPGMCLRPWMPKWTKSYQYWFADTFIIDPILAGEVNEFRYELGLKKIRRLMHRWWFSPDLCLGLFDSQFAPSSKDWPENFKYIGPTLWDPNPNPEAVQRTLAFAQAGSPPIVFVPGSVGPSNQSFFETAVEACRRTNQRAIFLHRFAEFLPAQLPPTIHYEPYVPLKEILKACSAIVHAGQIGTTFQGIAAGVRHLVCPRVNDQFDTAMRIERRGLGHILSERNWLPDRLGAALVKLQADPGMASTCKKAAEHLATVHAVDNFISAIDRD